MLKQSKKSIPEVSPDSTTLSQPAVQESNWFEKFFSCSQDPLCIGGTDGYFKKVNNAFIELLGYSEEELCNTPYINFIHPDDRQRSEEARAVTDKGETLKEFENRFCCRNGEIKWLQWSTTFLEDEKVIMAIVRDVTEKKKAEEELKQKTEALNNVHQELNATLERYQAFVQQSSEIVWRCELQTPINIQDDEESQLQQLFQGYLAECNDQMALFYGYKNANDVVGRKVADFIDPQEPVTLQVVRDFIQQGYKLYRRLSMHIDHKGNKRYFLNNLVGVVQDGRLLRVWTTQNEITQLRQARQYMLESEERFRQFADTAPVMIWVSDQDDNTIYVNKCWEEFTGARANAMSANGWKELIYPPDMPVAYEKYKRYFKYREPVVLEYRMKHKDGGYHWVVDHGVPRFLEDGTFMGYIGSVMDIHDRKLAEEKIRFQVQVMQDVTEGIISTDLDFTVISFNKAAENIYGIRGDEVIGKYFNDFIDLSYIAHSWEDVLKILHEQGSWKGQAWYNRKDGKRIYLQCSLSFVKNERGKRIGFAGIFRDITEARQAEEALRISEERYRSVVHALGEGIVIHDKNGEIIACNRSAETILGLSGKGLIGQMASGNDSKCIYEDGASFPTEQHPSLITLRTGKSLQNVVMGLQRADGAMTWISMNTEPVYYTQQRVHPDAVVASFVDITQKKAAEIELQRSQQQLKEYSERITDILPVFIGACKVGKYFFYAGANNSFGFQPGDTFYCVVPQKDL